MKKSNFEKIMMRFHLRGTALFLFSVLILSCNKDEDTLGLGVFPEDEQLGLYTTDTLTLYAKTVKVDSIRSDEPQNILLGSYVDPEFGQTTSSFSLQFQPSTNSVEFGDISTLNVYKVELSLVYTGYYGTQTTMQFEVKELNQDIYKDSAYYSTSQFQLKSENLLSKVVYTPDYQASSVSAGGEPEQFKMNLSTDFGKQLLEQVELSTETSTFIDAFKGINVSVDESYINSQSEGEGAIWHFDPLSEFSKITVFYENNGDSSSYDFNFPSDLAKVSHFSHNYTGTSVETALNDTTTGENRVYMQGIAGVATEVYIPHLKNLVSKGPVSVNKAELVFTIEPGSDDTYLAEYQYQLGAITQQGGVIGTIDLGDSDVNIGGDLVDGEYHFIMNREIQFLLNNYSKGENYNNGYRLVNTVGNIESARTIINGTKTVDGRLKLIVSYTPI